MLRILIPMIITQIHTLQCLDQISGRILLCEWYVIIFVICTTVSYITGKPVKASIRPFVSLTLAINYWASSTSCNSRLHCSARQACTTSLWYQTSLWACTASDQPIQQSKHALFAFAIWTCNVWHMLIKHAWSIIACTRSHARLLADMPCVTRSSIVASNFSHAKHSWKSDCCPFRLVITQQQSSRNSTFLCLLGLLLFTRIYRACKILQ